MKKLLIIFNLIIVLNCSAQTYQELQDIFYYTSKKLDAARDSLNALKRLDSVILIQKEQLRKDSMVIANNFVLSSNYEKQIDLLSDELYKKEEKPVFEFRGFYLGLSPYCVVDSSLIRNTIWSNLKYELTGLFKFNAFDKVDFSLGMGFPFKAENPYIKAQLEWRVFK